MTGNEYEHGIEVWIARWNYTAEKSWAYSVFKLNKEYRNISGKCVLINSYNTNNFNTTLEFYGDGKLIKNIPGTNLNITCYILKWFNKIDNNYYIIECCQGKICIYNIYNYALYIAFFNEKHESNFYKGFIYSKNDNDYLISGDDCGRIFIWNLITKTEIRKIYVYNENNLQNQIYHMNQWDKKYFYVYEFKRNSIIFIDLDQLIYF